MEALNGRTEESLQALEGERAEERAIVRVYILGPAALAISSQALCVFLAVWRRRGGPRYILRPLDPYYALPIFLSLFLSLALYLR